MSTCVLAPSTPVLIPCIAEGKQQLSPPAGNTTSNADWDIFESLPHTLGHPLDTREKRSASRVSASPPQEAIHSSGKLVVLTDGLGKHTTVELSEPLDEEISGVIEVVGRVTNQATIMCASYVQFREDKSSFDLELYNEALKIIHEFPEYYPFGTGRNT
ncbi:replication protein A 14 kDa subunit [Geospiza fortis]|uniref:Replication protein A 14 kDa subunit n=1 Tax=Geospiza fortis TaxID=48883 RepID=A0A6I9HF29_GEOFO|nr:replication protein A 14 kDa subunit [Geospiza fortis]